MCVKHGATKERKRCSVKGCATFALKGGVCRKHGAKIEYKPCSSEGCANFVVNGGLCIRHGAKVKICSVEGCTNQSQRGGVCKRHGAYCNRTDESTAFTSRLGSEFDKTTLTRPNQRAPAASASQGSVVPEEVVIAPNNNVVEV